MVNFSRRNVFFRAVAAVSGVLVAGRAASAAVAVEVDAGIQKVVYHLSDIDKAGFVLGNIKNHIEGMGGPDTVRIVLVVHGPALIPFHERKAGADIRAKLAKINGPALSLAACGNTMDGQEVSLADLLPGFVRADEGGVVRIAMLQSQGYLYLRP
ncbi:DsrE family protein [Pararhizobium sp.]|uniref:DsrE family protein n=1 Tax=Pararhizobium sp. TaxID=1977563 RepID=UPI002723F31F|nr:hypothetical protein [Pararhizobium sp.]MDO9417489.1 hypothetical protein [Pararhizobium sp.]